MRYLVTGGAGFIGSALCRKLAAVPDNQVVVLDKLTYAGSLGSLRSLQGLSNFKFIRGDICNRDLVSDILHNEAIETVIHLAAESHVDRSIDNPELVVKTNVMGTVALLDASLAYWRRSRPQMQDTFRFHHVSTDEVYGDLGPEDPSFTEQNPYRPSSPYAASKAASDHMVRSWHKTFGLPALVTNSSNNYGPFQFPEKLIPLVIMKALLEKTIPIYGDGSNVRDWLFVEDHANALALVAQRGACGSTYNIGGNSECSNLMIVQTICDLLDGKRPRGSGASYRDLVRLVEDRPGHDRRYSISTGTISKELGWVPTETISSGLNKTVDWYLSNAWWWSPILNENYDGKRLGLTANLAG